jgi:hypothetical protein
MAGHYSSGLLNIAAHCQRTASATEDTVLRASNEPGQRNCSSTYRRVGARSPGPCPSLSVTLVIGITSRPIFDPACRTCWSGRAICRSGRSPRTRQCVNIWLGLLSDWATTGTSCLPRRRHALRAGAGGDPLADHAVEGRRRVPDRQGIRRRYRTGHSGSRSRNRHVLRGAGQQLAPAGPGAYQRTGS